MPNVSEVRASRTQRGFSALELVIVLSVLTLLTMQFIPLREEYTQSVAEQYTLRGLVELANASKAFYVQSGNGAWPADMDAILNANLLPGYTVGGSRRFNNGFGNPYQVTPVADTVEISTEVSSSVSAQAITQEWGPLARFDPALNVITVVALRPGYEVAHDALLPRDGSRPMTGALEMQSNDLLNGGALFSDSVETNRVTATNEGSGLVQSDTVETILMSAENFQYKN